MTSVAVYCIGGDHQEPPKSGGVALEPRTAVAYESVGA